MQDEPTPRLHRLRSRLAMVAWCPTLYLIMLFIAHQAVEAMLDSADGLEVLVLIPVALILFGVGGHIAFGLAVALLIPAPRRRGRIVLLTLGTLGLSCLFLMSTASTDLVAVAMIAVPAGLGYLAAAPLPTTVEIPAPDDQLSPADAH